MKRSVLVRAIEYRLGKRSLVWFGTRGHDAESVTDIANFDGAFSLIATLDHRLSVQGLALEDLNQERVDLDLYDVDDDASDAVDELKRMLMRAVSRPSALFTYRPTAFLSRVTFVRQDHCQYLGMFRGHQEPFEYKPWIETELRTLDLPQVPWRYVDERECDPSVLLEDGPVMLRLSRTTGGVGLVRVESADQMQALWPRDDEGFVSVAPFIDEAIPMNVGGVVWHDGVTIHPASVQLIGIPGATTRPFGFCGNDFAVASHLDPVILDQVESATTAIGRRLGDLGYRGAFGVDFLVHRGQVLFTEVNPRFQGSTHASCRISVERGESCLLTEHLAAFLGLPAPDPVSLREHVRRGTDLAHLVIHHTGADPAQIDPRPVIDAWRDAPGFVAADVATRPALTTRPGGTVARVTVRASLTESGFSLTKPWASVVARTASAGATTEGSVETPLG